jgi:hypothetical protein
VYSEVGAALTTVNFRTFLVPPKERNMATAWMNLEDILSERSQT